MADIFLARLRTSLGGARNVVVKQILPKLSEDEGFAKMLTAEAKLAAQLNHAGVVQVFDLGREGGRLFIAMEYVEGFDLRQMLAQLTKSRIALPAEFALLVVREILRALDYAHRARDAEGARLGIVHRDVSPSNVLISFEGEVKLCDFGIARAFGRGGKGPDETRVQRARVAGKSAYMAPEQARGEDIDARADVFAAGILLWELCAGRRLFKGSEEEMLAQARKGEVPPLPERGLPRQDVLRGILVRALAKDVDARYATAAEMLQDLEDYAIENKLMASSLRFGSFLADHFAEAIVSVRREREKSADDLDDGSDPESFGPSSAPPPSANVAEIAVPKPPAVPSDLVPLIPKAEPAEPAETTEAKAEPRPEPEADTKAESEPATEPEPGPEPATEPEPEPATAKAEPKTDSSLFRPFSPLWLLAVAAAAVVVGLAVYFGLR